MRKPRRWRKVSNEEIKEILSIFSKRGHVWNGCIHSGLKERYGENVRWYKNYGWYKLTSS